MAISSGDVRVTIEGNSGSGKSFLVMVLKDRFERIGISLDMHKHLKDGREVIHITKSQMEALMRDY
jgi:thymidylate kinase